MASLDVNKISDRCRAFGPFGIPQVESLLGQSSPRAHRANPLPQCHGGNVPPIPAVQWRAADIEPLHLKTLNRLSTQGAPFLRRFRFESAGSLTRVRPKTPPRHRASARGSPGRRRGRRAAVDSFRAASNDGGAEPSPQTRRRPHSVSTPRGGDGKTYAAPRT